MVFPVTLNKTEVMHISVTQSWELLLMMQLLLQSGLYATSELLLTPISSSRSMLTTPANLRIYLLETLGKSGNTWPRMIVKD